MPKSLGYLRRLLVPQDRMALALVLAAAVVMALLEAVGIATILPFMQLVADPGMIEDKAWLRWIYDALGFTSTRQMLLWAGATALLLYTTAALFTLFTTWMIQRTVWSIAHRISMRLVDSYSRLPYEFFHTNSPPELIKKTVVDVNAFVSGVLLAGCQLVAYGLLTLVLVALMVVVRPGLALAVFLLLGGAHLLTQLLLHPFLVRLGKERLRLTREKFRSFSDIVTGVKAIRSAGASSFFGHRFANASARYAAIYPTLQTLPSVPQKAVELLAFGGLIGLLLYWLSTGQDLTRQLPVLTLFALAAYRLLPALNRAFNGAAQLSQHLPVIAEVHRDLRAEEELEQAIDGDDGGKLTFARRIQLKGVHYRYRHAGESQLCGVDLCIPKGSCVALVGPSGAGKSTLIELLVGLLSPTDGQLVVDGVQVTRQNTNQWRKALAYVPQDGFVYDASVASNIAFGIPNRDIDLHRVREAARMAQIDEFVTNELAQGYDTPVGDRGVRLSGGQRQRITLARAFYRRPEVLLLDEATSALDGRTEEAVIEALREGMPEVTIVMIAHRLSTVRHCELIYFMDRGRVVAQGDYDTLLASHPAFAEMVRSMALQEPR